MNNSLGNNLRDSVIKILRSKSEPRSAQELARKLNCNRDQILKVLEAELNSGTLFTDGILWSINAAAAPITSHCAIKHPENHGRAELDEIILSGKPTEQPAQFTNVPYAMYIQSPQWAAKAAKCKKAANGKCEICGSDRNLEVHHYNYRGLYCEEAEDIFCLCQKCHDTYHRKLNKHPYPEYHLTRKRRLNYLKSVILGPKLPFTFNGTTRLWGSQIARSKLMNKHYSTNDGYHLLP